MFTSQLAYLMILLAAAGIHRTMSAEGMYTVHIVNVLCGCHADCPSGMEYLTQPPTQLNCDPIGVRIRLQCIATLGSLTWYWTPNISNAGVSGLGIPILPEDNSDNYTAAVGPPDTHSKEIVFTVSNATLGYYWCEINNASLRPTTITPICLPMDATLPTCTIDSVFASHHSTIRESECAEQNATLIIPRPVLPITCGLQQV